MTQIVDLNNLNSKNDKIFFGEYSGFQRFDKPVFTKAVKLEESMRNAFWNPNEISMRTDAVKFHEMPEGVKDAMTKIWMFQTLMDSSQNRGLEETVAELVTTPEFECLFQTWQYFEMIHSISYSHIIRGIFVDSVDVFERNFNDQEIINRIRSEVETYSKVADSLDKDTIKPDQEGIRQILSLILTIYALEGIKFYSSFLITYLIHDKFQSIPGATRIIKLINFDEDTHTHASVMLLGCLMDDDRFKNEIQTPWFAEEAHRIFSRVLEDEKAFATYLIKTGGIDMPVSKDNVFKFLDYYADNRLSALGVDNLTNQEKTTLVEWFENYKDLNKENSALQESDLAVYNIGTLVDDL